MFASNRVRRASSITAAVLVGLLVISGPVVNALGTTQSQSPTTIATVPAVSSVEAPEVTTTVVAPVTTVAATAPVAKAAAKPVAKKAVAPTTTAAPVAVEIGTACVIEADGISTGCE